LQEVSEIREKDVRAANDSEQRQVLVRRHFRVRGLEVAAQRLSIRSIYRIVMNDADGCHADLFIEL
jgi:hypothetical protein